MSMPQALIAQARPQIVLARTRQIIEQEISKGCQPTLAHTPVALEPFYEELHERIGDLPSSEVLAASCTALPEDAQLVRLRAWISPDQLLDWSRAESFLKQLTTVSHRLGFEVRGNRAEVILSLLCQESDLPILLAAFQGEYQQSELTVMDRALGELDEPPCDLVFHDYYPDPPYSHLLTCPGELKASPLEPLLNAISMIEPPAQGLYQALFQPVSTRHNWHRNVEKLLDLEYMVKLVSGFQPMQRYSQQSPSGDLRNMAWEVTSKAHNDKPFFCLALRLAVMGGGEAAQDWLRSLCGFLGLFQHGGRQLNHLNRDDYAGLLSSSQMLEMFESGITYRPGFLVNSLELAGPVHLPPLDIVEHRPIMITGLDLLTKREAGDGAGTMIGYSSFAGQSVPVRIPPNLRRRHSHLIGKSGGGKSSLLEHMILSDIDDGHGVAVLDPHGDLVDRLSCCIPEDKIEQTIYFNPGHPDWVPIWNPMHHSPGQDIGRTADDMVRAIQSFVTSGSWGDRMEHILRNMCFSLIPMPHSTVLDLADLLRNKSEESKQLRKEILKVVDNVSVRQFWMHDFERYGKDDLGPPRNKLSKLLVTGTVSLMLSQPDSLIDFGRIMDQSLILLVNLSTVGPTVREILGCFILSLLHLNALGRSGIPREDRRPFDIYCDEAHRFMTDALEDLIAETRKFNVSLNLAHQYMSQFGQRKIDAFSSVGTTVIFNVDERDARYLTKDLRGKVKPEDMFNLEVAEAIARIGAEVVKFRLPPPLNADDKARRERIIENSLRRYYRPVPEVRKAILRRRERWAPAFTSLASSVDRDEQGQIEEFVYDEFS